MLDEEYLLLQLRVFTLSDLIEKASMGCMGALQESDFLDK